MEILDKCFVNLLGGEGGGGGEGGTNNYNDLINRPKINNTTLSGNKTSAQLGLVGDVQVNGTSVTTDGVANIPIASSSTVGVAKYDSGNGVGVTAAGYVYTVAASEQLINAKSNSYKPIVPANLDYAVRSVQPAYTLIEATTSTYNLAINNCYGQIPSQAVTYTLPAVTAGVDNWVKIFVDTTTTASIAIASADSKTINPNGTADIQTGHKYIIICQFNNLKDEWEIYIIDGGSV